MFLSTIEFVCGLLIGLVVGHLFHYKTYIQLCNINQKLESVIQAVESKSNLNPASCPANKNAQMTLKIYGKILKNSLIQNLSWTRTKVATQIRELRGGQAIVYSTLNDFYQRKTNPRKITVEAVQKWVDKEKEKENDCVNNNDNDM